MRLGNAELHILNDGHFLKDGGGLFGLVPKVLWQRVLPADDMNRVSLALHCLLIISEGKRILVDTGLGTKLSSKESEILVLRRDGGDLLDHLQRLGHAPEDIDIVINTHLHSDHCGGNTCLRGGALEPTFPNAEYWIQRQEWAQACYPNERTARVYLAENLVPVQESDQLKLLSGDKRVTGEVRCAVTRGHTQAHQSVIIESGGETALLVGDLAPIAVHMERLGWIPAYDTEPLETLETKRAMRKWALERRALLIFEHDVHMPMGYLVADKGHFRVQAPRT